MLEKVTQQDRIDGANSIRGDDPKSITVRAKILQGQADDHPAVRAGADFREINRSRSAKEAR